MVSYSSSEVSLGWAEGWSSGQAVEAEEKVMWLSNRYSSIKKTTFYDEWVFTQIFSPFARKLLISFIGFLLLALPLPFYYTGQLKFGRSDERGGQ